MRTFLIITILLFLHGCATETSPESSITPPQPTVGGTNQPPVSPELE